MKGDLLGDPIGVLEILGSGGGVDSTFSIEAASCDLGRRVEADSGLGFPDDAQMADRHARISVDAESHSLSIADVGEGSGVWVRISGPEGRVLSEGDQLWLGAQIVVVREAEGVWQVDHHGPTGQWVASHEVPADGLFLGRSGDVPLDAGDTQLSRRHAQLVPEDGALRVYDRGAHNGTFLRATSPETLEDGGEFRIAGQRIRFVAHPNEKEAEPEPAEEATVLSVFEPVEEVPTEPSLRAGAPKSSPETEPVKRGGLASRLRKLGDRIRTAEESPSRPEPEESEATVVSTLPPVEEEATVLSEIPPEPQAEPTDPVLIVIDSEAGSVSMTVEAGTTVLEAVQGAGIPRGEPVDWECGDGGCGVCIIGVLEGADRMDPPDPSSGEMKTIQITEQVAPDPRLYRLACLAKVRGTVRLRKLT